MTFVPIPFFLCALGGQKLLDIVGMGWCSLHCGMWLFLKLELCVAGPLFCKQLKKQNKTTTKNHKQQGSTTPLCHILVLSLVFHNM